MLNRDDMFDLVRDQRFVVLPHPAVFASMVRAFAHGPSQCRADHGDRLNLSTARAFACSTEMMFVVWTMASYRASSSGES